MNVYFVVKEKVSGRYVTNSSGFRNVLGKIPRLIADLEDALKIRDAVCDEIRFNYEGNFKAINSWEAELKKAQKQLLKADDDVLVANANGSKRLVKTAKDTVDQMKRKVKYASDNLRTSRRSFNNAKKIFDNHEVVVLEVKVP